MIQQLSITLPDGVTPSQVPYIEYELSSTESVGVVGIDYNKYPSNPIPEHPEVRMTTPGKLLDEVLAAQEIVHIQNTLRKDNWDFEKYPNPELILIRKKTMEEILADKYPLMEHLSGYDIATRTFALSQSWDDQVLSDSYPSVKAIWIEVPTWEEIINYLIKWSKTNQIAFDHILAYSIFFQGDNTELCYKIPKQIHKWAYDKFKDSFGIKATLIDKMRKQYGYGDNIVSGESYRQKGISNLANHELMQFYLFVQDITLDEDAAIMKRYSELNPSGFIEEFNTLIRGQFYGESQLPTGINPKDDTTR